MFAAAADAVRTCGINAAFLGIGTLACRNGAMAFLCFVLLAPSLREPDSPQAKTEGFAQRQRGLVAAASALRFARYELANCSPSQSFALQMPALPKGEPRSR